MSDYKILDWDSNILGFKVAGIVRTQLNGSALARVLAKLREQHIRLAYWGPEANDAISRVAADELNGFLTGVKRIYLVDVPDLAERNWVADETFPIVLNENVGESVTNLVLKRAVHSRFYRDPRMRDSFYTDIMSEWIRGSIENDTIFVELDGSQLVGFVSLNDRDGNGNIDVIAVDQRYAGRGYGSRLLAHAHHWFAANGRKRIQAVTQRENEVACSMYEKMGYRVDEEKAFYHFWL